MQPLVPGFGGTTTTVPFFPLIFALMLKFPLGERLMLTPVTALWVPFGSLYLKPFDASPDQNGWPVEAVPCFRSKRWLVGVPPLAMISRNAPPALPPKVGFPLLRVFGLPFSLPDPVILRLVVSPGFCFTESDLPRMVCSAAKARLAAQASPAAAARNLETCRMSSPLR